MGEIITPKDMAFPGIVGTELPTNPEYSRRIHSLIDLKHLDENNIQSDILKRATVGEHV
jgi:hypothetical protein